MPARSSSGCERSLRSTSIPGPCGRTARWAPPRVLPGQGYLGSGFPNQNSRWKRQGLPGSWGTPWAHALLSDPGGILGSGHLDPRILPSALRTASASTKNPFRGSITRPGNSLSTLRCLGHHLWRKTRFWLLASFARRGWLPAGSHYEVSGCSYVILPPRPGLAWRTLSKTRDLGRWLSTRPIRQPRESGTALPYR